MSPNKPLHTRFIHYSLSHWTIYRSFEIIIEWELPMGLKFKLNVLCKSIFKKHIQTDMTYILKMLTVDDCRLGSNGRARVKRWRTKSRERLLRTTTFYSCYLQYERERPDMKRKYMNSDKAQ